MPTYIPDLLKLITTTLQSMFW